MVRHTCGLCTAIFTRRNDLNRHINIIHDNRNIIHQCVYCGGIFNSVANLRNHRKRHKPKTEFYKHKEAHNGRCVIYRKGYDNLVQTLAEAYEIDRKQIRDLLNDRQRVGHPARPKRIPNPIDLRLERTCNQDTHPFAELARWLGG